ncbi:hypothetical protein E1B28_008500 [Marasmius oreades]|uniref:F-box domain-containing protein n=1 Tax=Marasmius oreades TaxID=181124 RepID=A0A9P7RYI9_9AGAR|nr:uncharacterized protein E1B28_008500 [Marasmius oreades]KAG7092126.1 hypothetical protein E1B28_008500 [Marasmius oreades]
MPPDSTTMATNGHDFSKYFQSNDFPSFHDTTIIRERILEKSSRVTRMENEISLLKEKLQTAKADLELHQSLLSGVRRLPTEILGEIFMLCAREDCSISTLPDPMKAPMLFCQISKAWRAAATSNPLIWSTFGIDVSRQPRILELTKLWFQRSQKLPLILGLRVNLDEKQELQKIRAMNIQLIKESILPNFTRCRSFTLRCAGEFDDSLLEEIPVLSSTNLEHLDLPLDLPSCPFMFQWCFHLAISSPQLRRLTCGIPSVLFVPSVWSNIERVDLRFMGLTASDVESFLRVAPRLRQLSFGLVSRASQPQSLALRGSILEHDTLRSLQIYDRFGDLGSLIDFLKFPKLVALSISGRRYPWPHGQMLAFLERSNCALRLLNVESTTMTSDDLISYLSMDRIRRSLEDLRVNKTVPTSKTLLEFLTLKSSSENPVPIPRLRSFMCSIDAVNQASHFELFLKSRWHPDKDGTNDEGTGGDSVSISNLKRIYLTIVSPVFDGATIETPALMELLEKVGKEPGGEVSVTMYRLSQTFDEDHSSLPPEPPSPPTSDYDG